MISNERPSPFARFRRQQARQARPTPKPVVPEMVISEESVQIERKQIQMKLKENRGGRFLRIVETNGVRFNSVVIPASGLADFQKCLATIVEASQTMPPQSDLPPAE
jgi:hypothetical protein